MSDEVAPFIRALGRPVQAPEVVKLRVAFGLREDSHSSLTYWESEERRLALASEAGAVRSVFLFAAGKDGYQQYKGSLPLGITFEFDRRRIRSVLGHPADSGFAAQIGNGTAHGGWDKYVFAECSLHFTYASDSGRLALVTLEPNE